MPEYYSIPHKQNYRRLSKTLDSPNLASKFLPPIMALNNRSNISGPAPRKPPASLNKIDTETKSKPQTATYLYLGPPPSPPTHLLPTTPIISKMREDANKLHNIAAILKRSATQVTANLGPLMFLAETFIIRQCFVFFRCWTNRLVASVSRAAVGGCCSGCCSGFCFAGGGPLQ